jgi:hypothetical protein
MRHQDRIALSWCDPGTVDGAFTTSLITVARDRHARLHPSLIRIQGGGLLSRTRNLMVATFLDQTDAAWLWMVDSDHTVDTATFDLLVNAADADHPVMSGLYFGAFDLGAPYPAPVPCVYDSNGDGGFVQIINIAPHSGIRQVAGVGTGCLLIHRSVLQAMRDDAEPGFEDWCWFADGPTGDGRWMSEDLTFCKRLSERGVPIHVHTDAVLPHHKMFWQDDTTFRLWRPAP